MVKITTHPFFKSFNLIHLTLYQLLHYVVYGFGSSIRVGTIEKLYKSVLIVPKLTKRVKYITLKQNLDHRKIALIETLFDILECVKH